MTTSIYTPTQSLANPPASALDMSGDERMQCARCEGHGRVYGCTTDLGTFHFECPVCKGEKTVSPDEQLIAMAEAGAGEPVEEPQMAEYWTLHTSTDKSRPRSQWATLAGAKGPELFTSESAALACGARMSAQGVSPWFYEARKVERPVEDWTEAAGSEWAGAARGEVGK